MRIYIIEDDIVLRRELANLLELQAFEVEACEDFSHAGESAVAASPDCILLDLKLPSEDGRVSGHAILREIRKVSEVPIIVLTSVGDEFSEVMALKLGANDFIYKPYRPAVLLARIEALLSRFGQAEAAHLTSLAPQEREGVRLDLRTSTVSFEGREALLTRNEVRILALLMRNAGTIISRSEIMCDLWESDAFVDDNTLTVNINRLRKKLDSVGVDPAFLQTRRGQGYLIR